MTRRIKHQLVVEIECLDAQGQRQAQDRLHRWLETYGYTSSGNGFEFISVGVMTGKRVDRRRDEQQS
jgi:hypothetical protein